MRRRASASLIRAPADPRRSDAGGKIPVVAGAKALARPRPPTI